MAAVYLVMLGVSLARTDGHFSYSLDDAYIHMGMAKNLANHGVFGVTPHGFTSSSSSPLWVVLVACCYRLFGVTDLVPFLFNAVSAVGVIRQGDVCPQAVRGGARDPALRALWAGAAGPDRSDRVLRPRASAARRAERRVRDVDRRAVRSRSATAPPVPAPAAAVVMLAAALVAGARYEGLFLVAGGALLLAARRRVGQAALVAAAGLGPAVGFGLYSLHHGWPFLPASILLKGRIPQGGWRGISEVLGGYCLLALAENPYLMALVMAGVGTLLVARRRGGLLHAPWSALVLLALIASLLHLQFARAGLFYRYEAYLIALWIVALAAAWPHLRGDIAELSRLTPRHAIAGGLIAVLAAVPLVARAARAHLEAPTATREIYSQQHQMGRFVQRYYRGRTIAANDIGVIDYLTDIDLFDLYGLGTREVVDAKRGTGYHTAQIDSLTRARGVEIAMAYEDWFGPSGGLPDRGDGWANGPSPRRSSPAARRSPSSPSPRRRRAIWPTACGRSRRSCRPPWSRADPTRLQTPTSRRRPP